MAIEVFPVRLGVCHCYVIRDKGAVMVDSGPPAMVQRFLRQLGRTPVRPEEIKLIVLTARPWRAVSLR